jgi:hypothetical protein
MSTGELLNDIAATAQSVGLAIGPLTVLFLVFHLFFLKLPLQEVARVLAGSALAAVGLFLFLLGVSIGFLPFGRAIGESAADLPQRWMVAPLGALLGFVTTWGEPSVRVLANEVEGASGGSIRRSLVLWTVSSGVAAAVAVGMARIAYDIDLLAIVVPGYVLITPLMKLADRRFVGIAIDAGGVATGPLANTFLLALALGTAAAIGRDEPLVSGLGLVALIALAPVVALTLLGIAIRIKEPKERE